MYGVAAVVTGSELTLVCVLELVLLSVFRLKSPISFWNFCPRSDCKMSVFAYSTWKTHGKPQTANLKVSRDTVLRLRFQLAVHVWTTGRASCGKWLTARLFASKICTASRLKAGNSFFIRLRCVCWIYDLESMNYSCFLGHKSDALRLDEKQQGGTKQWTRKSILYSFLP